jgi:glycosyltransferase involved in cell wall biosynthesis
MQILVVVLNARLMGGLEICSRDVALSLRRLGHSVDVVCTHNQPHDISGWDDIPVHFIAPANYQLFRLYSRVWLWFLARYLRKVKNRYDRILIMHPYAAYAAYRARVSNYCIWTYGIEVWGSWAMELRQGLQAAEQLVAISNYTATSIRKRLPQQSITIIPPTVNINWFIPTDTPREPTPPYRLLTVGRLSSKEQYKGHDRVIRNLKLIQEYIDAPVEYWIVGDGDDRTRLEQLVHEYDVVDQVCFWGRVSDQALLRAYQDCDIFVMPSEGEGFGIVYLEASACGKPVIGSNVGGAVDTVEEGVTGFCIDPKSDEALIETVGKILLSPGLAKQMGQAGIQHAKDGFSPSSLDKRLKMLLKQMDVRN